MESDTDVDVPSFGILFVNQDLASSCDCVNGKLSDTFCMSLILIIFNYIDDKGNKVSI